jgi:hypothetical protein
VHHFHTTYLGLLALLEERVLARLVGSLVLGEVAVLADLVQNLRVDALQIHVGRGSDDISGVYPSQRNAVDFEGTGDEEDTLGQVLEQDDALATETASEEDDNGARLERGPGFRRADSLASLEAQSAEFWRCNAHLPRAIVRVQSLQSQQTCIHNAVVVSSSVHPRGVVTYLLLDGDVLGRVVLARLLGLLFLFVGRHFELLLSLVALEVGWSVLTDEYWPVQCGLAGGALERGRQKSYSGVWRRDPCTPALAASELQQARPHRHTCLLHTRSHTTKHVDPTAGYFQGRPLRAHSMPRV